MISMCLVKKSMLPRIALKDITVYKVIIQDKESGKLYTPVTGDIVEIGKTYKGKFKEFDTLDFYSESPTYIKSLISDSIDTGYIHSNKYISKRNDRIQVLCIIPKGTLYFIGTCNDYASRKLKYVKIIK